MICWMSNCENCPSGGAGCGDTLERASVMGTSAPFTYFTVCHTSELVVQTSVFSQSSCLVFS